MADLSDVSAALATVIQAAIFPSGTSSPSITGDVVWIVQGWPDFDKLTAALAASQVYVSIFPRPGDVVTTTNNGDADWFELTNNGTTGTGILELRRQTRTFQITIWANCFDKRDPIAKLLDAALAATSRLTFAEGTSGVVAYVNSLQDDSQQKAGIYRRDLFYSVNYPTISTAAEYAILHTQTGVTAGPLIGAVGTTVTVTT